MKPAGKDGFGYEVTFGAAIPGTAQGAAVPGRGFYMIVARAAAGSVLPAHDASLAGGAALGPGDFCWLEGTELLPLGDSVRRMTIDLIGWMTDDEQSASKQVFDQSTAENARRGVKAYAEGAFVEKTGSLTGQYDVGSPSQEMIERRFGAVIKDDGTLVTRLPIVSGPFHLILSRRETSEVGEMEVWEYKPCILTQLTQRKPMDGTQEFNCSYTVDGNYKPAVYKRRITA